MYVGNCSSKGFQILSIQIVVCGQVSSPDPVYSSLLGVWMTTGGLGWMLLEHGDRDMVPCFLGLRVVVDTELCKMNPGALIIEK